MNFVIPCLIVVILILFVMIMIKIKNQTFDSGIEATYVKSKHYPNTPYTTVHEDYETFTDDHSVNNIPILSILILMIILGSFGMIIYFILK